MFNSARRGCIDDVIFALSDEGNGDEAQPGSGSRAQVFQPCVFGFEKFDVFAVYRRLGLGADVEGFDMVQGSRYLALA
jgi:hypothetical protein